MEKGKKALAWTGGIIAAAVIVGGGIYSGFIDRPPTLDKHLEEIEGTRIERIYVELPYDQKVWSPWYDENGEAKVIVDSTLTFIDNDLTKKGLDEIIAYLPSGQKIEFKNDKLSLSNKESGQNKLEEGLFPKDLQKLFLDYASLYNKIQDKYFPLESIVQQSNN